jgi:hypothetical protein
MTLQEASKPAWKNAEILINCLLVKDFSKVVNFKVACRTPQLRLSLNEFIFNGDLILNPSFKGDGKKWQLSFSQENNDLLSVFNLLGDELECTVINDTVYFSVVHADNISCTEENNFLIERQGSLNLRIVPRLDLLLEHIDYLRKVSFSILI